MSTHDSSIDSTHTGRHPVNISHLVMGLAFVGLVTIWAAIESGVVSGDDIRWLLPLPWIVAGGAGLVAAFLGSRRSSTDHPSHDLRVDDPTTTQEI
ncbi:hypothetical protein [Nocardioides sp.]|uniref:hypothetical protein n=1 Tax=Nocardioides sp. TaxID=35761 RepID=UPI002732C5FD|nr:hypothetical protein [Nocardioides sp.]MDP3890980.1 hypothetical protein [Nocardioides sp.]